MIQTHPSVVRAEPFLSVEMSPVNSQFRLVFFFNTCCLHALLLSGMEHVARKLFTKLLIAFVVDIVGAQGNLRLNLRRHFMQELHLAYT